jgi:hypothetical protein
MEDLHGCAFVQLDETKPIECTLVAARLASNSLS